MGETRVKARKDAFERALTIGNRLTQATEAINQRLRDAEQAIVGLGLGVRASVSMPAMAGDESGLARELTFGKFSGEWALIVGSGPAFEDEDRPNWDHQPLLNASREIRFAAIDLLPVLIEVLVNTAEAQVEESEAKAEALEEFMRKVNGIPF